jgi:hypothetical protein
LSYPSNLRAARKPNVLLDRWHALQQICAPRSLAALRGVNFSENVDYSRPAVPPRRRRPGSRWAMRRGPAVMSDARLRRRLVRVRLNPFVQMMRGVFDVKVLVLTRSTFGTNDPTAVHFLEIAVRELVPSFGLCGLLVVDAQMPLAVVLNSMPLDKIIFLLRGRLVLAPSVPLIEYEFSVVNELLGVVEASPVEFHGHDRTPHVIISVRVSSGTAGALRSGRFPPSTARPNPRGRHRMRDALTPIIFRARFLSRRS